MRIVVVGAGPAGLYLGLLMKKQDPSHEVTVLERNAPDATFGWGVVFSEEALGALRDADRGSYDEIVDTFAKWNAIDVRYRDRSIRSRGHVFSAIARKRLLGLLQRRCASLGVDLRFHQEVDQGKLSGLRRADLVVGADGVNSLVRRMHSDAFGPQIKVHSTKFAWFGTDLVFNAFTFIFRENEHGLFQVHGYPFDAHTSTFIVECAEETWRRAGLDGSSEEQSIAYCERLFAEDLNGHRLLSNRSAWISFVTLRNEAWHHQNVVLVGDAAHTAHFTIGSGTKLAMEDSVALAEALQRHPGDLGAALTRYELERQPVVERFQQAALESSAYFENVRRYAGFEPVQFAFNLLTRSGRVTHLNLEMRDPAFVTDVDRWFAGQAPSGDRSGAVHRRSPPVVAPPPMFSPIRLAGVEVTNRVAVSIEPSDDASDGLPSARTGDCLSRLSSGAGLVITEMVAVSEEGRITPGSGGLYRQGHVEAWRTIVDQVQAAGSALAGVLLGHAGRRGATRPRWTGADRPLREGAWPLLSASAIAYTDRSSIPEEVTRHQMSILADRFSAAARTACDAGFGLLDLDMGHGYLLASFLSPLTNHRTDGYGGSSSGRMRFPLEVFDAVRASWPPDRPLAARLSATDWVPGGWDAGGAVSMARALRDRGCDLIHVVAGQTVEHDRPLYGRQYLVPFADRVRNEAGIPVMVGGNLTTSDEINTILAAGRGDLCLLSLPRSRESELD